MRRAARRRTAAALVAVVVSGAAACSAHHGGTDAAPAPSTAVPRSPADVLRAAFGPLAGDSYRFDIHLGTGVELAGKLDPKAHRAAFTLTPAGRAATEVTTTVDSVYVHQPTGRWLRYAVDDCPGVVPLLSGGLLDATKLAAYAAAITNADAAGPEHFTGTLDLARLPIDQSKIAEIGPDARAVPLTAEVDDRGRLTHLRYTVPGPTPVPYDLSFDAYGAQFAFTVPADADVDAATDDDCAKLGS